MKLSTLYALVAVACMSAAAPVPASEVCSIASFVSSNNSDAMIRRVFKVANPCSAATLVFWTVVAVMHPRMRSASGIVIASIV